MVLIVAIGPGCGTLMRAQDAVTNPELQPLREKVNDLKEEISVLRAKGVGWPEILAATGGAIILGGGGVAIAKNGHSKKDPTPLKTG
jgi:hypothetical protein